MQACQRQLINKLYFGGTEVQQEENRVHKTKHETDKRTFMGGGGRVYKYTEVTRKIEQETLEYTAEPNQRKTREAY